MIELTQLLIRNVTTNQVHWDKVSASTIRSLIMGDKYEAVFTFTASGDDNFISVPANSLYFNIGLFVPNGETSQTLNPATNTFNRYLTNPSTLTTSYQDMVWAESGLPLSFAYQTGRNLRYEVKKADNSTVNVRVNFIMTADVRDFIGEPNTQRGQWSRMQCDRLAQAASTTLTNGQTTVYQSTGGGSNKKLGVFLSAPKEPVRNPGLQISESGGIVTIEDVNDVIDFIAEGFNTDICLSSTPINRLNIDVFVSGIMNDYTIQGNNATSTPANATYYTVQAFLDPFFTTSDVIQLALGAGGFPTAIQGNVFPMRIRSTPCNEIDLQVGGASGATRTSNYYYEPTWGSGRAQGLFVNEGIHTQRVLELERGGNPVTTLHVINPTNVKVKFNYTGTVTGIRFWLVPTDFLSNTTTDWLDYVANNALQFGSIPFVNTGGNAWEGTHTINPAVWSVALNVNYLFFYVIHDTVTPYDASYTFTVRTTNATETPTDPDPDDPTEPGYCLPLITGTVGNYIADFANNYLAVSPLQRVFAEINIDKADYETCRPFSLITGVRADVIVGGATVQSFTFGNSVLGFQALVGGGIVQETAGNLKLSTIFRINHSWENQTIDVKWTVTSSIEPQQTIFTQKFDITPYEQNKPIPDQALIATNFYNADDGSVYDENNTNCEDTDVIVETVKTEAAYDYAQIAVWLKPDLNTVDEESAWVGGTIIPQSTNSIQSNVDIYFSDPSAPVIPNNDEQTTHIVTATANEGFLGMIGYPPPIPAGFGMILLHHTYPFGNAVVFQASEILGTKTFTSPTNSIADFTFKTATGAGFKDPEFPNWNLQPNIPLATFLTSPISAGTYVKIEYTGVSPQVNILSYLTYVKGTAGVPAFSVEKNYSTATTRGVAMFHLPNEISFTNINFIPDVSDVQGTRNMIQNVITTANILSDNVVMGYYGATSVTQAVSPNKSRNLAIMPMNGNQATVTLNSITGGIYADGNQPILSLLDKTSLEGTITDSGAIQLMDIASPVFHNYYPYGGTNPISFGFNGATSNLQNINDAYIKTLPIFHQDNLPENLWIGIGGAIKFRANQQNLIYGHFSTNAGTGQGGYSFKINTLLSSGNRRYFLSLERATLGFSSTRADSSTLTFIDGQVYRVIVNYRRITAATYEIKFYLNGVLVSHLPSINMPTPVGTYNVYNRAGFKSAWGGLSPGIFGTSAAGQVRNLESGFLTRGVELTATEIADFSAGILPPTAIAAYQNGNVTNLGTDAAFGDLIGTSITTTNLW